MSSTTAISSPAAKRPSHLIVSPGPCTPREAGISCDVITRFAADVPILGVPGHQSIGYAFGRDRSRGQLMHRKTDWIHHNQQGLFEGANPLLACGITAWSIRPGTQ
jgi:anthranilate/para-aminobenzoate synthase component II